MVGQGKEVKMEPGQQLHIVNELYPYTVQFKEDSSGNSGCTKRPHEPVSEDGVEHTEAPSVKVAKQRDEVSVSVRHEEGAGTKVRKQASA